VKLGQLLAPGISLLLCAVAFVCLISALDSPAIAGAAKPRHVAPTGIDHGGSAIPFWHLAWVGIGNGGLKPAQASAATLVGAAQGWPSHSGGCELSGRFGLLPVKVVVRRVLEQDEQGVGAEGRAHGYVEQAKSPDHNTQDLPPLLPLQQPIARQHAG
jgi:hypothetical protein